MELENILHARTFYESWEWCELRYETLQEHGWTCVACGIRREDGAVMTVDHVMPRSIWPEYALDPGNLQVLCSTCNRGKSNRDTTDFRMVRFPKRGGNGGGAANDTAYQLPLPLVVPDDEPP